MRQMLKDVSTGKLTDLIKTIIRSQVGQHQPGFEPLEVYRVESVGNIIVVHLKNGANGDPAGGFKVTVEKWPE